jgi:hypothetical protein
MSYDHIFPSFFFFCFFFIQAPHGLHVVDSLIKTTKYCTNAESVCLLFMYECRSVIDVYFNIFWARSIYVVRNLIWYQA